MVLAEERRPDRGGAAVPPRPASGARRARSAPPPRRRCHAEGSHARASKPSRPAPKPARADASATGSGSRADALRRIAARVSGRHDLQRLFDDVIDESFSLFGVERAGLWRYEPDGEHPLTLAAARGLSDDIIEAISHLPHGAGTAGMAAIHERRVRVLDRAMRSTTPSLREIYRGIGVRSICYVPIVFGDEPLGLLVLYHGDAYAWTDDELDLARAFGDHMATAIGSARLAESRRTLADRLTSIAELAGRLSHLHGIEEIAWAIVSEAQRLIDCDTIRVYGVDREAGTCEPIAFQGTFLGRERPGSRRAPCPHRRGTDRLGRGARPGPPSRRRRQRPARRHRRTERRARVDAPGPDVLRGAGPRRDRRLGPRLGPVRRRRRDHPVDLRCVGGTGPHERRQPPTPASAASRARAAARGPAAPARGQRAAALDPRRVRRPRPHRRLAQGDRPVRLADRLPGRSGRQRPARRHRPRPLRRDDPRPRERARHRHHRLGHRPRRGGPGQRGPPRPAFRPGPRDAVRAGVDDRRPAARSRARRSAR